MCPCDKIGSRNSHVHCSPLQSRQNGCDGVWIIYSTVCSDAGQRKHQSPASLAFVWGIVNSPHKGPVTQKIFPFDDVIIHSLFSRDDLWHFPSEVQLTTIAIHPSDWYLRRKYTLQGQLNISVTRNQSMKCFEIHILKCQSIRQGQGNGLTITKPPPPTQIIIFSLAYIFLSLPFKWMVLRSL